MSMKCSNCGAAVTDDSNFCKYCGAKIDDNTHRIEISGTVNKNVTHRFAFNSEARIRKIEAKKELEEEKLRQQTLQAEIRRKQAQEEHDRFMKKLPIYFIIGIFCFIGIIILINMKK